MYSYNANSLVASYTLYICVFIYVADDSEGPDNTMATDDNGKMI